MTLKNKIIRYCFFIIILTVAFGIAIGKANAYQYTNYFGIEMTTEEYFTLLNLGFTDDEIYYMDKDTFDQNKDLDAELIAQNTKYYKLVHPMYGASYVVEVSQNEYLNSTQNQPMGTVTTEYFTETSSISANGSKYRYKNTVSWLNLPNNRSFDVIAIGFINSVYIDSYVYYKHSYADSNGTWHNSTLYYDKKTTSLGGTVTYKIPQTLYGLSAVIYFDVSKNTQDTLTSITMCGDYAHSLSSVTQTQAANHVIYSSGLDFDASVYSLFSEIPCADATAYVNW